MSSSPQTQETERSGTVYMLVVFINQGPTPLMLSKCGTESRFFCAHIEHKTNAVGPSQLTLVLFVTGSGDDLALWDLVF